MEKPAKIPAVRIECSSATNLRYIASGKGKTYRCYGVATNGEAANKLARQIRIELRAGYEYKSAAEATA